MKECLDLFPCRVPRAAQSRAGTLPCAAEECPGRAREFAAAVGGEQNQLPTNLASHGLMVKLERLRLKTDSPSSPQRSPPTCASLHAADTYARAESAQACSRGLESARSAPTSPQRQRRVVPGTGTRAPRSFESQRPATQRLGRSAWDGPLPFQSYKQPEPLRFPGSVHEPDEARRRDFRSREKAIFYHKLRFATAQAAREGLEPDPCAFERCVSPKRSLRVVARHSPSAHKTPLEPFPVPILSRLSDTRVRVWIGFRISLGVLVPGTVALQ